VLGTPERDAEAAVGSVSAGYIRTKVATYQGPWYFRPMTAAEIQRTTHLARSGDPQ